MGDSNQASWPHANQRQERGESQYSRLLEDLRLGSELFAQKFAGYYLWRPASAVESEPTAPAPISFNTSLIKLPDRRVLEQQPWCLPLRKKQSNPFAHRLTLGRAPNCDVVVRLPFVSKLHACLIKGVSDVQVCDMGSGNGTAVNGRRLMPQESVPLLLGDILTLGTLDFEFVDALTLYVRISDHEATR